MEVRVYDSLETLDDLVPQWNQLLDEIPTATTFSTWEWLAPWWRAYGSDRKLLALGFFDSRRTLAGLALLAESARNRAGVRTLRFMGDGSSDSDNLDLMARPGFEEELARDLIAFLETRSNWEVCALDTLPSNSPAANSLLRHLRDRRWTCLTSSRPWSVVPLPGTWEEYLKRLSSKERGKVGYLTRRLEKRYRTRYVKCTESELNTALDVLFRLHQTRWKLTGEPGSFSVKARREFYAEMSELFLKKGWLEFWVLELDGKPVAAQFGFRYRDTVFSLQEGFDPEYSLDSVGYVLRAHVLRHLIEQGVRRYDFLAGESPVKARWGADVEQYMDIHFAKRGSRGALYLRSKRGIADGKEWLRDHAPQGVWQFLHGLNVRLRGMPQKGDETPSD